MAGRLTQREIGIERTFNLGPFKNLRLIERVIAEGDWTEAELDLLRETCIYDLYLTYGLHKELMELMKDGEIVASEDILAAVRAARQGCLDRLFDLQEAKNE